jgi:ubiquinone/menaquinone biosynthesis C-methylase UbiE
MDPGQSLRTGTPDYRGSHLSKGDQYDAQLATTPFDAYLSAWERRRLPAVLERFVPGGPRRYLDFACGTGRITEQVAPLARESVGVDISESMIAQARLKCPRTQFHVADLTQGDPDLGQFDLVTSFRFFGNAQDELRDAALRAITRRLAPGGHLVINSHRNPRALYALLDRATGGNAGAMDLHHGKLEALMGRHGLRIVGRQPIGAWMFRASMLARADPDEPRAAANEARFSAAWLAPIAPDAIVIARKV